jgi:bisphosphoglycerate-dependent phosphoglycerate mutase
MSNLEDEMMERIGKQYTEALARSMRQTVNDVFQKQWYTYQQPDYYFKRKYGKWTIYNKDGMRVVWGLNEREMKNYMKLLKKEE